MKVLYLLSHVPNPRIYKRMRVAKSKYKVLAVYWKRSFKGYKTFFSDDEIIKHEFQYFNKSEYGLSLIRRISVIFKFLKMALKILKKEKPEIIHCEHLDMLFISVLYNLISKNKAKIVYEVADLHDFVYSDTKSLYRIFTRFFFKNFEKILMKKINFLIVTSPYFIDEYYKSFIEENKIIFIPNAPEKKILKKVERKNKNGSLVIGFIGAVRYTKQLKNLIDIVQQNNNFEVIIAGNGASYEEILKYSKNVKNVKVLGEYDYDTQITSLYQQIDLVYSVYSTGSKNVRIALPNRLYEAIVTNKPIIASKNTMLGEFIQDKGIGILVNDEDKEELKAKLEYIFENKEYLEQLKNNCEKIESEYYLDFYNQKLIELYENI